MDTIQDPYLRHLFETNTNLNTYNHEIINLSVGAPGPDLLKYCANMLNESTQHRLEEEEKEGKYYLFQYGTPVGLWECRDELAKFLSRRYGNAVMRKQLILTCGASHGLQLLMNIVFSPNGVIFVEEVTYMIVLSVFKQFPLMKVVPVPMKDDVVDLDALEKIIAEEKTKGDFLLNDQKIFWAMFYTIPTFHNPTGMTLSPDQCKRLVEIARNHSIMVVCDDVYNLLYYGQGLPSRHLFSYDDPADPNYKGGNVTSNCSFSKIFSPAIRFGWMECCPRVVNIIKDSGIMHSGGAVNHYVSGVIASMLHKNIEDEYLDIIIKIFRERLEALCTTLDQLLPSCCSYRRPQGGYFVWIHLRPGIIFYYLIMYRQYDKFTKILGYKGRYLMIKKMRKDMDATKFLQWCQKKYKIWALQGTLCSYKGENKNCFRLSISFHTKEVLQRASQILCEAILTYITHQTDFKNVVASENNSK